MAYKTEIQKVNGKLIEENAIKKLKKDKTIKYGASLLQKGEVVAFPTETVYGLGADASREKAVRKIFKAKGRPQDNPLIVHIGNKKKLEKIIKGEISVTAEKLMKAFWPGPLTLIFSRNDNISSKTTAGLDTVGVRMPSHPVARALIELSSLPIAAPSANSSGFPSPTRAQHVYNDLDSKIPLIIDGGSCQVGVESTVVNLIEDRPVVLRPGGITREEISRVIGEKVTMNTESEKEAPSSPGMKYRHYSPSTPVRLLKKEDLIDLKTIYQQFQGLNIALVVTTETKTK